MDSASRHAYRVANTFMEDMDEMRRASRAADRRAMSHFEHRANEGHVPSALDYLHRRRRSLTAAGVRSSTPLGSSYIWPGPSTMVYRTPSVYSLPATRVYTYPTYPTVAMVGKSMTSYPYVNSTPYPGTMPYYFPPMEYYAGPRRYGNRYWREPLPTYADWQLPTSSLKAHTPAKFNHLMSPRAQNYLYTRPKSLSLVDLFDYEDPAPPRRSYVRRQHVSRLGSVPPVTRTAYHPTLLSSDTGLSSYVSRSYVPSYRPVTETPYYLSPYAYRSVDTGRPILSTHYSVSAAPVTSSYTYYYPSATTSKLYGPHAYTNLSQDLKYERSRIQDGPKEQVRVWRGNSISGRYSNIGAPWAY